MRLNVIENEPLAKYTSWRIGGPARYLVNAATPAELREALRWAAERELPAFLLGGGTNVLVRDAGWPGLVIRYRAQELRVEDDGEQARAWIAAGAPMAGTARRLARQGWAGLEWAEGLPGTIGGAVFGNAGCYGGDVASTLIRAWLLVGDEVEEWPVERLGYGYRSSVLKSHGPQPSGARPIVLAAEFRLRREDPAVLRERMERTAEQRKSKTPWGSSCGSVFKNPPGDSAGRLIEAAGLKGTRVGAAEIAQKHANYIVNLGGASSDDVLRLIEIARERVLSAFGVALELEVQIV
ncbi:MAG: UDP-N-acetylmuramate dehydrogenase [Chloroflexota bacterium]